jgi:hypothetical protein
MMVVDTETESVKEGMRASGYPGHEGRPKGCQRERDTCQRVIVVLRFRGHLITDHGR